MGIAVPSQLLEGNNQIRHHENYRSCCFDCHCLCRGPALGSLGLVRTWISTGVRSPHRRRTHPEPNFWSHHPRLHPSPEADAYYGYGAGLGYGYGAYSNGLGRHYGGAYSDGVGYTGYGGIGGYGYGGAYTGAYLG